MAWRPHGRAKVNARQPQAWGSCDRCGFNYNLVDLHWQHQYAGTGLINIRLKVCSRCYDKPSEFLRTIVLPPDPVPVDQPRPEPYQLDEAYLAWDQPNEFWDSGLNWDQTRGGPPAPPTDTFVTEDGDTVVTEDGDDINI